MTELEALRAYVESIEARLADLESRIGPRLTASDYERIRQEVRDEWDERKRPQRA